MTIHRRGEPIEDIGEAYEPDYPPKPDQSDRGWDEIKEERLEKTYPEKRLGK